MPVPPRSARPPHRRLAPIVLLAGAVTLGGCRYTTFPLIPPELEGTFPARLTAGTLVRAGDDLVLNVTLDARRSAGYLSVAWFREDAELGRDSVYLDATEPRGTFRLAAPEKANYRAVVSFEGDVLRQFELEEVGRP